MEWKYFLILVKLILFLKVDIDINLKQKFCTLLNFKKGDPVNFSIDDNKLSYKQKYIISIEDIKGKIIIKEENKKHSISYNFLKSGQYNFCVKNLSKKAIKLTQCIKYGIYIGNISDAVKNKNTNELLNLSEEILSKATNIKYLFHNSHYSSLKIVKKNKKMEFRILAIGFFMISFLLIMIFVQLFLSISIIKSRKFA